MPRLTWPPGGRTRVIAIPSVGGAGARLSPNARVAIRERGGTGIRPSLLSQYYGGDSLSCVSRYCRAVPDAAEIPARLWPGRLDFSVCRYAVETWPALQPPPAYCLPSSSPGRNRVVAEPRLYQHFCRIWTLASNISFQPDSGNCNQRSWAARLRLDAITTEMLLKRRDAFRSADRHKQRALTLSRFARPITVRSIAVR